MRFVCEILKSESLSGKAECFSGSPADGRPVDLNRRLEAHLVKPLEKELFQFRERSPAGEADIQLSIIGGHTAVIMRRSRNMKL